MIGVCGFFFVNPFQMFLTAIILELTYETQCHNLLSVIATIADLNGYGKQTQLNLFGIVMLQQ